MINVSWYFTPGQCCATGELCILSSQPTNRLQHRHADVGGDFFRDGYEFSAYAKTTEDAWKRLIAGYADFIRDGYEYDGVQVRYIWFVNYNDGLGWHEPALRTIIQSLPHIKLGEIVNSNTGHKLDGYMLTFECVGVNEDDDF